MKLRATVYQATLIINQKLTQFSSLELAAMATISIFDPCHTDQLQLQAIESTIDNPYHTIYHTIHNRGANMKSCADKSALQVVVNQSGSQVSIKQ